MRVGLLAGTVGRRLPTPPGLQHGDIVWQLDLDESSGATAADTIGNQNGSFINPIEYGLNPVANDGGTCISLNGVNSYISAQHFDILNLLDVYTLLIWGQARNLPPVGAQDILFSKLTLFTAEAGAASLELYNDNGVVVGQAKLTTAALGAYTTLRGTTGIGLNPFLLALSVHPVDGAVLSLNAVVQATDANLKQGLQNNNASIRCGIYHNDQGPFDGALDRITLVYGALSMSEIANNFPDAISTTFGTPPVQEMTCAARSGVNTTHKNLGTVGTERELSVGGSTPYDCSGTTVEITWDTQSDQNPSPISGFQFVGNHNGACCSGGAILGNILPETQWGSVYPDNGGGVGIFIGSSGGASENLQNILVEGFRAHRIWDAGRCSWTNPRPDFVTVRGCWFSDIHDDSWENDQLRSLVVVDCLFDGVFSGISTDNTGSVPSGTEVTFNGMLMRLRPMGSSGALVGPGLNPGHGDFIKNGRDGNPIPHHLINCVFAAQQAANKPAYDSVPQGSPFYRLLADGTVGDTENNTMCWLNTPSSWIWELPPNTTLLTGNAAAQFWANARSNWISAHPQVERFGSPADDGFTIPGL